jgi:hypothetical protein
METRTRELQSTVETQIAEIRNKADSNGAAEALDDATATAAEAAAEVAADVEDTAGKAKKAAKDAVDDAAG